MENFENKEFNQIKLDYIKTFLDSHLESKGIYDKLNNLINKDELLDEDAIADKIHQEGIIDDLIDELGNIGTLKKEEKKQQKGLYLKLNQISDFYEFNNSDVNVKLEFDILFLGQRVKSKKFNCSSEINLDQAFFLDFNPTNLDINIDFDNLLRVSSLIHIVIIKIDNSEEESKREIISTKLIEWRWVLCYGTWKVKVDLFSHMNSSKNNIGNINMTISLVPLTSKKELLSEKIVFDYINAEKRYLHNTHQDFVKYSNLWWEDFKNIRNSHSNRIVKIFANSEDKENYSFKPSCSLLYPIISGRSLSSPFEAARFVSLIPFKQNKNLNGNKEELYNSVHSMLSMKQGDIEDHCVLLCNILLGFGLEAYVAVGLSVNGPHTWVLTRGLIEVNNPTKDVKNSFNSKEKIKVYEVTFWESLTGQRIKISDPKVYRFYKSIHSIFSDKSFYANVQADDSVYNTNYVFEDESSWKSIPKDKIDGLIKYEYCPDLKIIPLDFHKHEIDLEKDLKLKISKFRNTLNLSTQFDSKLGYLLVPALSNYESERISGITYGNEEFKQSIKNYVEDSYTFKAFPCHDINTDSISFFSLCLNSDIGKDIIYTKGDNIRFAVRCKIIQYPQDILSCWVMIAVKYRQIK